MLLPGNRDKQNVAPVCVFSWETGLICHKITPKLDTKYFTSLWLILTDSDPVIMVCIIYLVQYIQESITSNIKNINERTQGEQECPLVEHQSIMKQELLCSEQQHLCILIQKKALLGSLVLLLLFRSCWLTTDSLCLKVLF